MRAAHLISDIIANEMDDEGATKHFPEGSLVNIDDSDDDWFLFEDASGVMYECEEQPDLVLKYIEDTPKTANTADQPVKAYVPVPNMTPLERKYLLL